jgi:hypothetical protein
MEVMQLPFIETTNTLQEELQKLRNENASLKAQMGVKK